MQNVDRAFYDLGEVPHPLIIKNEVIDNGAECVLLSFENPVNYRLYKNRYENEYGDNSSCNEKIGRLTQQPQPLIICPENTEDGKRNHNGNNRIDECFMNNRSNIGKVVRND